MSPDYLGVFISYFSIIVMKCYDGKKLMEERVYIGLQFQLQSIIAGKAWRSGRREGGEEEGGTDRQTDTHTHTYRERERERERQRGRQAGRHTDKQTI